LDNRVKLPIKSPFPIRNCTEKAYKKGILQNFERIPSTFPESTFSAGNYSREQKGDFWRLVAETSKAYSGRSRRRIDERFVPTRSCG